VFGFEKLVGAWGWGKKFEKFGVGKGSRNGMWGWYLRVGDWTLAAVY
jgi:hypothetical protein